MTKPIEGWVAWHETQGTEVDFFKESKEAAEGEVNAAHRAAGWKVRPVRLTFTDKAKRTPADIARLSKVFCHLDDEDLRKITQAVLSALTGEGWEYKLVRVTKNEGDK